MSIITRKPSGPAPEGQLPPGLPKLGDIVGNCRVVSVLGEGAIAIVYKVFDIDLEIERALKMLKPGAQEYTRRKFEAEAKVAARLDHPNIVKVHGGGTYDGRLPFMVMEYVDGKSLRMLLLAHRTFPTEVSLAIISLAASALDYANRQSFSVWGNATENLVHRDLKPENILLSSKGVLKVADFGLAQLGDEKQQTGWGTPAYMSPEQHDHLTVDCRSDIFSLGVMLYEMLSGVRPFSDTEIAGAARIQGAYTPVRKHNPTLPESVRAIVDRCLQPDARRRFKSYESLRMAVDSSLAELTLVTGRDIVKRYADDPTAYRQGGVELSEKGARRRTPKVLLAVAVLLGALITALAFFYAVKAPLSRDTRSSPGPAAAAEDRDSLTGAPVRAVSDMTYAPAPRTLSQSRAKGARSDADHYDTVSRIADRADSAPESLLKGVLDLYKSGNFSAVVAEVNQIGLANLDGRTRDSALVLLIDSYYMTRAIRDVIALSREHDVNDIRYCAVVALALEILGDFPGASKYIDRAVSAPAVLGNYPRSELLYDRAQLYLRRNRVAGDNGSAALMTEAFRLFVDEGCARGGERCDQARDILRSQTK